MSEGCLLNSNQIQEIIPHRYPFLLVDKITEMVVGESATGVKSVTVNEPFFQGHFPQEHVMPGVLIVEAMAQVGAVCILSEPENKGKIAYFAGIKSAKFKKKVVPGDQLVIKVDLESRRSNFGTGKCIAYVDGQVACKAELSFAY